MSSLEGYPKRLIEVDLPIKKISEHARREKSTSTITGLHLWWARRPLAACRAVVCSTLWPDPFDEYCPLVFVQEATGALLDFNFRARQDSNLGDLCGPSPSHWAYVTESELRSGSSEARLRLRTCLLGFIAAFANPKATDHSAFIETARRITHAANRTLLGSSTQAIVLDPFAGGGSIPLEALRAGANAVAGDINPVALLINDVLVRRVPSLRSSLSKDSILNTARCSLIDLERELGGLYPATEERIPIAYLWARTVLSEAPASGEDPVEVPLVRSMWLSKRPGNLTALRWVRNDDAKVICDRVTVPGADGIARSALRPRLQVFHPTSQNQVEPGTASGGGVTCPVTGYTMAKLRVRAQLTPRRGGTRDARLLAVVTRPRSGSGRQFHLPTSEDEKAIGRANELYNVMQGAVDEPLPVGTVWKNNPFRVHNYGMMTWGDLFTPRQHLFLSRLAERVAAAGQASRGSLAETVQAILALTVARLADHLNSCCTWNPAGEKLQHLFARQAVPMVWDFCEANPLGGSVGDWIGIVAGAADALAFVPSAEIPGEVLQASATECPLPDDSIDAVITDPPYYDAVPYADLSEFFYVWLRRCAPRSCASWFTKRLIDRAPEIVFDTNRGKDTEFYVRAMTAALAEARRVTKPTGICVVVFAHKSTAGWEALLQAVLDAGWVITASWPIDTELATRVRAMDSAALASSVHIVCRPRESSNGSVQSTTVGDWRDILAALPNRIHEWMPRLAEEGIVGADAIFACLGPALEIFSRYARVEKASGDPVSLKEYLEHVWAAVAKEALAMIFAGADATGFEEDARLTAMWLWTLSTDSSDGRGTDEEVEIAGEDDEEDSGHGKGRIAGFVLEYDAARKIAQGLGAHLEALSSLVEVKGSSARLLRVAERTRALFGKSETPTAAARRKKKNAQLTFDFIADLDQAEKGSGWGETGAPEKGATVIDRVHQAMILFGAGRGEALRHFLVDDGAGRDDRLWRLAQALSALYPAASDEKRWVDGVLARKRGLGL